MYCPLSPWERVGVRATASQHSRPWPAVAAALTLALSMGREVAYGEGTIP